MRSLNTGQGVSVPAVSAPDTQQLTPQIPCKSKYSSGVHWEVRIWAYIILEPLFKGMSVVLNELQKVASELLDLEGSSKGVTVSLLHIG